MPDPVSALILAGIFAFFYTRTVFEGAASAKGREPHSANNRHAERMQRMQHDHERWMARAAERRTLRERGHSTIGRALQNRVARWVENAGRRVSSVEDSVQEAERRDVVAGRTPGLWRTAWRRARQVAAQTWRGAVERAEERLSNRYDRERPILTPEPATKVVTEDDPKPAEETPKVRFAGSAAGGRVPPPPGAASHAQRPTATGSKDNIVDAEIVDEPAKTATAPGADVIDADFVEVTEPKSPASRELEAAAPPSNVFPINRGERMSEPTQTLVLSSGETVNPETGIAFADGLSRIYSEMGSRIQGSIANLSQAGVAQDQIAKLAEMLNLNSAAQAKAEEMKEHFADHQNAAALVGATGAGTNNGYLGQH